MVICFFYIIVFNPQITTHQIVSMFNCFGPAGRKCKTAIHFLVSSVSWDSDVGRRWCDEILYNFTTTVESRYYFGFKQMWKIVCELLNRFLNNNDSHWIIVSLWIVLLFEDSNCNKTMKYVNVTPIIYKKKNCTLLF